MMQMNMMQNYNKGISGNINNNIPASNNNINPAISISSFSAAAVN